MELNYTSVRAARLSAVLKEDMKLSTGLMNKLKWDDRLLVNGVPRHTDFAVQAGDRVTVLLDEAEPQYPAEYDPITVLYEDEYLLAVDKPAGILIHPSRSRLTGTLANRVIGYYEKTGQSCAFHPITRLDRDTFGIVLLAKNSHIHARMQQIRMDKTYHALTFGGPESDSGIIDAPIARRPLPSLLRYIAPEGKPSVTEFAVLERNGKLCKLALKPITGRTHQLRLHCAHMGYPILGDPQYGSEESMARSDELGLHSQLLCAKKLEFTHPVTGEYLRLVSQMDAEHE